MRHFRAAFSLFLLSGALTYAEGIRCPYIADQTRKASILNNYTKVKPGMSPDQVVRILGTPDEERPILKHVWKSERIGTSFWYIIQRIRENGSSAEKNEILVRISFDPAGKVVKIDKWGF